MKLGIYGTGGAGKEIYELVTCNEILRQEWEEIIFIDDTKEAGTFWGCRMLPFSELVHAFSPEQMKVVIGNGEPKYRKMLAERVRGQGYSLATLIHPAALVSSKAVIGEGVIVQDYVDIVAEAHIRDNVCINGHTIIGHNADIGENSQICSHVIVAGGARIGECAFVGASSAVRDEVVVGENVIISMGAMVMKDVRDHKVVMGNPAREIAENTEQKVF